MHGLDIKIVTSKVSFLYAHPFLFRQSTIQCVSSWKETLLADVYAITNSSESQSKSTWEITVPRQQAGFKRCYEYLILWYVKFHESEFIRSLAIL